MKGTHTGPWIEQTLGAPAWPDASALGQAVAIAAIGRDRDARMILLALLAQIEGFGELDEPMLNAPEGLLGDMQHKGVPYQPDAWFDGPLPWALRKRYSRAARRLEQAGLVSRITEPRRDRVRCLRPTPAGLRLALQLAGPAVARDAIITGLQRTSWGSELTGVVWERPWPGRPPQASGPSGDGIERPERSALG